MFEDLLKYQEIDSKLYKIENDISNSEARKKGIAAKKIISGKDETVERINAHSAEINAAYENAVSEFEKLKAQEEEFMSAIENCEDSNSISYLQKKLDELLSKIGGISAELNRLTTEIQSTIKEYNFVFAQAKKATEEMPKYLKEYNDLKASKEGEIAEIKKELEPLKNKIPKEYMEMYNKNRAEKKFPVFCEQKDNRCGYCGMEIPMAELEKIKNGEFVECYTCHKLIVKKG